MYYCATKHLHNKNKNFSVILPTHFCRVNFDLFVGKIGKQDSFLFSLPGQIVTTLFTFSSLRMRESVDDEEIQACFKFPNNSQAMVRNEVYIRQGR